jgi:hypothetical protein
MVDQLYEYKIDENILANCEEDLFNILKINTTSPDQNLKMMARDLLEKANVHCEIQGGYRILKSATVRVDEDTLSYENVRFESGDIVAQQLHGSSTLIIFAGTLGPDFDDWSRSFFNQGDPFSGYVADVIGSLKVEQAIEWISSKIESEFLAKGLTCTNRYSPGYCGWDVYEQHKLFNLLPQGFLGITLHPSALMTPIKSVSGVIGAGKHVQKHPYTCAFCTQENCFMRRGKNGKRVPVK